MTTILCGLSWLAAFLAWLAVWSAVRECLRVRRNLHRFRRGLLKDIDDATQEALEEVLRRELQAKPREPSSN